MPTSARKVRGQSGWFIRIIPPVLSVRSRDDVGIVPYAKRDLGHSTGHDLIRKGSPPHPEKAGPPSPSRRGHGLLVLGCRKIYGLSHSSWPSPLGELGPPHPSRAAPGPPSPWGKASSGGGCFTKSSFIPQYAATPPEQSGGEFYGHPTPKSASALLPACPSGPGPLPGPYPGW